MKSNLSDVTFLFPIRLDSVIRLENLQLAVKHLKKHFITNTILLEAAEYNNGIIEKLIGNDVQYYFIEDRDPVFYRTKYINKMIDLTSTPILAIWDADVIVPVEQIINSVEKLRMNDVDMIYPYDGHFYDTSDAVRELYFKTKSIKTLHKQVGKMHLPYGDNMLGGAFLVNKESYIKSGKENERYYGWGPEDGERFHRWRNLGFKVLHNFGNLYHLSHPRGINSSFRSLEQARITRYEVVKTRLSSKEEIIKNLNLSL
jgi:predicted glycosyltransferase involved in capsule biosynthesis